MTWAPVEPPVEPPVDGRVRAWPRRYGCWAWRGTRRIFPIAVPAAFGSRAAPSAICVTFPPSDSVDELLAAWCRRDRAALVRETCVRLVDHARAWLRRELAAG
ncbi:hypothetical protein tb265_32780 [Gemmatimonadetes bacterium T265]|nr:hypothetical protein tb265_32780 [Gemmatimonadetes bacterium T265]